MAASIRAQLDVKIRTGKRPMARRRGPWCSTMVGQCSPERGPLWSASTAFLPPYHPCSTNALPPGAIWLPRVRVPRGMAARR
jgi:hypothetical protein